MPNPRRVEVAKAVDRMVEYAEAHPEIDTQGIDSDEWWELAWAALGGKAEAEEEPMRIPEESPRRRFDRADDNECLPGAMGA